MRACLSRYEWPCPVVGSCSAAVYPPPRSGVATVNRRGFLGSLAAAIAGAFGAKARSVPAKEINVSEFAGNWGKAQFHPCDFYNPSREIIPGDVVTFFRLQSGGWIPEVAAEVISVNAEKSTMWLSGATGTPNFGDGVCVITAPDSTYLQISEPAVLYAGLSRSANL